MIERRTKRSEDAREALQYLVEATFDRSEVRAVALVDASGAIVAGCGAPRDLVGLAKIAGPVDRATANASFALVTEGTDYLARGLPLASGTLWLAALGTRVRRMNETASAIERILDAHTLAA